MNTIKFRGKILRGERKGEWVYGSYLEFTVQGVKNARIIPTFDCKEEVLDDTMDITIDCIAVDPETVGQYTGMKDDKKQEIYSDDIVTYPRIGWDNPKNLQVVFRLGSFGVFTGEYEDYPMIRIPIFGLLGNGYRHEVIGNIHDNKNLIT